MAILTINIGGVVSTTKNISAGDITRLTAAMTAKFKLVAPTNQQIIDAMAAWYFNELVTQVLSYEQANATQTAVAGVTPVAVT